MKAGIKIEMAAAEIGRGRLREAADFFFQRDKMRKMFSSSGEEVKVQFTEMFSRDSWNFSLVCKRYSAKIYN